MRWDPDQYAHYADERGRPFHDLVNRIRCANPRRVVDLGCGTGELTALLAERWPAAVVEGVDSSPEMIASSAAYGTEALQFRIGDLTTWQPSPDTDVIISNAALQWVPGHLSTVANWAAALPSGGWLAFQVPGNFAAPSHSLMRGLASSTRWSPLLGDLLRDHLAVATPAEYAATLLSAGLITDVWETTYLHVLSGADPVLDWVRGTGLRPVLAALSQSGSADDVAEFEADYGAALRAAYPAGEHGTVLPFRRIFAVGHRA